MLKLFQFAPAWGLPNASPFCMKVETYLRMRKLPYETVIMHNPAKAPKGKLPFIQDDKHVIADSSFIIDYLEETYSESALDKVLTAQQRAQAILIQRMLEEHLSWVMMYSRWVDAAGWEITRKAFFASLPIVMRSYIANVIRKRMIKALYIQGLGRHTAGEIYALARKNITALAIILADQSFMLGEVAHGVDACVYSFLANFLECPVECTVKSDIAAFPQLVQYCDRMKQNFYT
ncbi:MAG: glutathione S-transferase C-terminal domain-containing protein [Gammaproteobacteria bacterium]